MPYEELPHTADLCLRVWAADLATLFVESARGMNAIAGYRLAEKPRFKRRFSTSAVDAESLLVAFLSELVYFAEKDHLAFDHFEMVLDLKNSRYFLLSATLNGAPLLAFDKVIKAVTYHNLRIQRTARGYEIEIVFDV